MSTQAPRAAALSSAARDRPLRVEPLETRLLWAAAVPSYAPSTLAGLVIDLSVTQLSPGFDGGQFRFRASTDDGSFEIVPVVGFTEGSGTYTYARLSPQVATVRTFEPEDDLTTLATLTFNSLTAGTFVLTSEDTPGSASGTFKLIGTVEPLAEIEDGTLVIEGTFDADSVGIGSRKGNILVTQNNWTSVFSAADVKGINVDLRDGNDLLQVGSGVMGIYCFAGTGNDNLTGAEGRDTLTGGAGKDTMDGGPGDDRLNGAGSHDAIIGGEGNDRLYGGDGNDFMQGGGNVDRLFGGNGNDLLVGNSSNDKLYGEAGDDTLYGNAGSDILNGGDDTDVAISDGSDVLFLVP